MELKESRRFETLNGNWVTNVPCETRFFSLLPINAFGQYSVFSFIFRLFVKHCCGRNLTLHLDAFSFLNKLLLTIQRPAASEFKRAFLRKRMLQMLNVSKAMFH